MQHSRHSRFAMTAIAMSLSCAMTAATAETDATSNGLEPGIGGATAHEPVVFETMVQRLFKRNLGAAGVNNEGLMHAAIGMSGEASELIRADSNSDPDNVLEELGDFRFYAQEIMATFGWTLHSFTGDVDRVNTEHGGYAVSLTVAAGDVLDLIKKSWVYGKELDATALYDHMNVALYYYCELAGLYGFTETHIQEANIEKLVTGPKARYASGYYTDAAAIARADKVGEEATA